MIVLVADLVLPSEVKLVLLVARRPLVFGFRNLCRLVVVVVEVAHCMGYHDWIVVVETFSIFFIQLLKLLLLQVVIYWFSRLFLSQLRIE